MQYSDDSVTNGISSFHFMLMFSSAFVSPSLNDCSMLGLCLTGSPYFTGMLSNRNFVTIRLFCTTGRVLPCEYVLLMYAYATETCRAFFSGSPFDLGSLLLCTSHRLLVSSRTERLALDLRPNRPVCRFPARTLPLCSRRGSLWLPSLCPLRLPARPVMS